MGTHIPPTPHIKLKEVLSLTGRLAFYKTELWQKKIRYTKNQQLSKNIEPVREKRAWDNCQILLKVKIRALEEDISIVNKKLEKLPKLCQWCRGKQLISTGPMTDRICPSCCGDGLEDGPNQQARRDKIARMVKRMHGCPD